MSETQALGPITLFVLMLIVGLELTVADFRRVMASPVAVIGGTLAQLVALPLLAWGVAAVFALDPVFAVGAVLMAASPGAGASNILAFIGRGNVALSVTLTGLASLASVITLPAMAALSVRVFLEQEGGADVPIWPLLSQLIFALLLPISLGMWIRARFPGEAVRWIPRIQRIGMLSLLVLVALAIVFSDQEAPPNIDAVTLVYAAAAWSVCAMAMGWGLATLFGMSPADRFTFLIEFSTRNIAVTTIAAFSGLGRIDLALFGGIYAAVGYPLAGTLAAWRRFATRPPPDPPDASEAR